MRESEAWRAAAQLAIDCHSGLCYGIDRLVKDHWIDTETHARMCRAIDDEGRARFQLWVPNAVYIWDRDVAGQQARTDWAEWQAVLAERREARDDAAKVSGVPGRDEGAGDAGELPVVPLPELWSGDLRGAEQRAVARGTGDAAGAAGGGVMEKDTPKKPVREYKVSGTYSAEFHIRVTAGDPYEAEEKAKEGVERGDHEVGETNGIEIDTVEERYGEPARCPSCDQALDLDE